MACRSSQKTATRSIPTGKAGKKVTQKGCKAASQSNCSKKPTKKSESVKSKTARADKMLVAKRMKEQEKAMKAKAAREQGKAGQKAKPEASAMAHLHEVPDSEESDATLTATEVEEPQESAPLVLKPKLKMVSDQYGIIGCRLVYPKGSPEAAAYKEKMKAERADARAAAAQKNTLPDAPEPAQSARYRAAGLKKPVSPLLVTAGSRACRAGVGEVPDSEEEEEMSES